MLSEFFQLTVEHGFELRKLLVFCHVLLLSRQRYFLELINLNLNLFNLSTDLFGSGIDLIGILSELSLQLLLQILIDHLVTLAQD